VVDGVSTYNVVPFEAGQYFNKIQCFCFEEQRLNPHEQVSARSRVAFMLYESCKSIKKRNADSFLFLCRTVCLRACGYRTLTHVHASCVVCRWICPSFSTLIPNSEKILEWKISNQSLSLTRFSRLKRGPNWLNLLTPNKNWLLAIYSHQLALCLHFFVFCSLFVTFLSIWKIYLFFFLVHFLLCTTSFISVLLPGPPIYRLLHSSATTI